MDLVRPWLAAIAVFLAASLAMAYVASSAATPEQLATTGGTILWNAIPALVIYLVTVAFAAVFHRAPHRDNQFRHALAVFAVPAAAILISLVYALATGDVLATAVSIVFGLVGAAAGWTATVMIRKRKPTESENREYF